ncbi:MAG: diguanylate cyclase [Candidatus Magnetoovum sp. WYHC-5]|nr:diguanylate cyclase [Candidatus Magnetoovum sp. WYHC-5]
MSNKEGGKSYGEYGEHPIQLAEKIWWVGYYLEDDVFQCNPYLIEHGEQSVLVDPGSVLTFKHTLKKIEQIIPFTKIRYFICHHQDPDITGALTLIDKLIDRPDARIITHWRAEALIKHYAFEVPFFRIEENNWQLDLGGRLLKFIYTPYLHFPGAFTTFDTQDGVLFSSDIFGGFSEQWELIAKDERVYEGIRLFHEHYMPSREILTHGIDKLSVFPIKIIAPQHGSILQGHLINFVMNKLREIDCGLYLLSETETDIHRLSKINKMLGDVMETMIIYRDFHDIANAIMTITKRMIPAVSLEFYCLDNNDVLHLSPVTRFRGKTVDVPPIYNEILGLDRKTWNEKFLNVYYKFIGEDNNHYILLPLFSPENHTIKAIALFLMAEDCEIDEDVKHMLKHMNIPLEVAVERELILRRMDAERQIVYERSIRDALTGLFNRVYMNDMIKRILRLHDRDKDASVAVILIDIDFFKKVNDTFGHNAGDKVLQKVAHVLVDNIRNSDLPVRLGGEEFAVFVVGKSSVNIVELAERIRIQVSQIIFGSEMTGYVITISGGVAIRKQYEPFDDFLQRADTQLYRAKNNGRNMICFES